VTAVGITGFAYACRSDRRQGVLAAVGSGLLLGAALYLSYGLVLIACLVLAVAWSARDASRARRSSGWLALGVVIVCAAYTLAGFRWWDGYHLLVQRYYQGLAADRPYSYWVWANLASLFLATGPAVVAGLTHLGTAVAERTKAIMRSRGTKAGMRAVLRSPLLSLPAAALLAVASADLSGLSKSEVERIWLPFGCWLTVAAAVLPGRQHRGWLAGQAGLALAVNHLVLTRW